MGKMNRRAFVGTSLAVTGALGSAVGASEFPAAALPNILFILADDLGYGDIGCYNNEAKVATPNLDGLAGQGMRFTDAHAPATVCSPSRYSLLTGRMAFRIPYRGVFEGVGGPCLIKYFRRPEIEKELKALLESSKVEGRSRSKGPGP